MRITWYGHACFRIDGVGSDGSTVSIVTDPYTPPVAGYDPIPDPADIVIMSSATDRFHSYAEGVPGDPVVIDALALAPGHRDEHGVRFTSVATMESVVHKSDADDNAIYTIELEGLRIGHLGDVGNPLGRPELELLRGVDVLLALAGGPPTIELPDLQLALAEIGPAITIPMHFRTPKVTLQHILDVDHFTRLFPPDAVEHPGGTSLEVTRDTLPAEHRVVVLEHAC